MASAPGATVAFRLKANSGYSLLVLAGSRRADGRGQVILSVERKDAYASYFVPATVTTTAVKANFGRLGRIDVRFEPSGVVKDERSVCDSRAVPFDAGWYRGQIEFAGEEGYTRSSATSVHAVLRPWLNLVCPGRAYSEATGSGLPGARLRLASRRGSGKLTLQVNENRPGARMRFEASIEERRGRMVVVRHVEGRASTGTFSYARGLQTATLRPPSPFAGGATFRRGARPANRWTGNLSLDFPGHSNVRLTGSKVNATLVPAERNRERVHGQPG